MKKILIPLDGSELAEHALVVGQRMSASDVVFVLLRVLNPMVAASRKELASEARENLEGYAARLKEKGHPAEVRVLVLEGPSAETIIDIAEEEGAGLIIMTTHGSGGLARWLMGSVAERVVRHAPCPVLTIGRRTLEGGLPD